MRLEFAEEGWLQYLLELARELVVEIVVNCYDEEVVAHEETIVG